MKPFKLVILFLLTVTIFSGCGNYVPSAISVYCYDCGNEHWAINYGGGKSIDYCFYNSCCYCELTAIALVEHEDATFFYSDDVHDALYEVYDEELAEEIYELLIYNASNFYQESDLAHPEVYLE